MKNTFLTQTRSAHTHTLTHTGHCMGKFLLVWGCVSENNNKKKPQIEEPSLCDLVALLWVTKKCVRDLSLTPCTKDGNKKVFRREGEMKHSTIGALSLLFS